MRQWAAVGALLVAVSASAAIPSTEREALVSLYQSTHGSAWTNKTGWLGAAGTECTWYGVTCNEGGTGVQDLNLSSNNLAGPLPAQLGSLTNLIYLWLGDNKLTGSIPKELGALPKLYVLSAAGNGLTGSIPAELGNLPAIWEIDLSYNQLKGGIPAALGKPKTLEILSLLGNPLGGTIPKELGELPVLRTLILADAQLTGTIPAQLWDLDTLEELRLDGNDLQGSISADVARLGKLRILGLSGNEFAGPIPAALGDIVPLQILELQGNALTGAIPAELGRLSNLTVLSVWDNRLSGAIPAQLGSLVNLEELRLSQNELTGAIPDGLRALTKLEVFSAQDNRLTGALPSWIGELSKLVELSLGNNRLRGTVPQSVELLEQMVLFDLARNEFSGRLPDVSRMKELRYLWMYDNLFTGPLPAGMGALAQLVELQLQNNSLTGPIPRELGNLANVEYFDLGGNAFDGTIPAELGNLPKVYSLTLSVNRLGGTIPKELGNLPSIQYLALSFNALRGPIPKELTKLTKLEDGRSDFRFNALFTTDASVRAFINSKQQDDGDFEATQTVPPTNVRVTQTTDRNATVAWTPIRFNYTAGGYQVVVTKTANGAPVTVATTRTKEMSSITVRNLEPGTKYFFTVSTVSHPFDVQQNVVVSEPVQAVSASTGQRVIGPADVVIVEQPAGMVRVDGAEVATDRFSVTNFGDVATQLTAERGEDFFTVSPEAFTLAPGATQVVTLRSVARPAGSYYGYVVLHGAGTDDDDYALVALLAASRPVGTVVATPLATTVEVAGVAGADSVGVAQFRNTGTAPLTGFVLSDQPWIEPPRTPITIEPGAIGTVNFTIKRSRRPASEGALVANLRLVYVSGGTFVRGGIGTDAPPGLPGVSVSIVTVVDTTRPAVSTGSIPSPGLGELPLFIPGIRSSTSTHSDLALFNALGSGSIGDLKLYFTRGSQTSIAALQPLAAASALNLVNLVDSIYDTEGSGALQVRTADAENLETGAKVTAIAPDGTRGGAIPVFRADRSLAPGESLYLAGIAAPGDVLLQETGGASAAVHVVYLDAAGTQVGTRDALLDRYELVEWNDAIPANAATAMVTAVTGSFTAYARLRDAAGDVWSVVDWSRFYRYDRDAVVRVPFADGRSGVTKRRVVRNDNAPRFATALVLFNPGTDEARVNVDTQETGGRTSSREVTIPSHATVTLTDAASSSGTPTAQLVITPLRGEVTVTARSRASAGGTAIPVLDAGAGLRLGQRHTFTALDDATSQRTGFGFAETSGATVTVRARIFIEGGNALVTTVTERDYDLGANAQVVVPELVRAFAGEARESLGDLHNLVLEIEIVSGGGSVVPFVLAIDEGTGDTSLQL